MLRPGAAKCLGPLRQNYSTQPQHLCQKSSLAQPGVKVDQIYHVSPNLSSISENTSNMYEDVQYTISMDELCKQLQNYTNSQVDRHSQCSRGGKNHSAVYDLDAQESLMSASNYFEWDENMLLPCHRVSIPSGQGVDTQVFLAQLDEM